MPMCYEFWLYEVSNLRKFKKRLFLSFVLQLNKVAAQVMFIMKFLSVDNFSIKNSNMLVCGETKDFFVLSR